MAPRSSKKTKKDNKTPPVETEIPSRTRSGRKRADSAASTEKKASSTTAARAKKSISPVSRHTRSAAKKKPTKEDEEDVGESILVVEETEHEAADDNAVEVDDSPAPKRMRTSNEGATSGSASKASDRKKKKGKAAKQELEQSEPVSHSTDPAPAPTKPAPTMDVSVHRVRHLNYQPKPILCLATTPFDSKAADYVALSRENGTVELKSPDEKWRTVASVAGLSSRTVDVMAWTCGTCSDETQQQSDSMTSFSSKFHESHSRAHARRTCLGASRDGTIFVIDFAHGCQSAVTGSGGGGIFSLISLCGRQCCSGADCPRLVAAGCQDGSIRIYRVVNDNKAAKLELVSTVPCASTAILSLAWRRTEKGIHDMGGTALYAGVADGTIRRLDCVSALTNARLTGTSSHAISTGTVVSNEHQNWKSTLRMTVESYGRTTPTRVWALQALADGTIVSADSLGHVQIWDGNTGTLIQSFDQNDNKADVLALAVSANECRVFASGVDSRVICVERPVTVPSSSTSPPKWLMTHAQRPHTHDVKAMAMCNQRDTTGCLLDGKPNETLCSGGIDTKLCTYDITNFGKFRPKSLYPWPCISPISVANEARILAMRREDRVDLYKLAPPTTVKTPVLVKEDETLIGAIGIKGRHNFICSDITNDGHFLVLSNSTGLTLFRLEFATDKRGGTSLEPTRVEIDRALRIPCLAVKFVSNNRLACAGLDGQIQLLKIDEDPQILMLQHSFPASPTNFAIQSLHVSPDGAWLAAERSGTESGTVQVYSIAEDDCKHWWSLPALESPVTSTRFLDGENPSLVVTCASCAVYLFDIEERRLSNWSEQLGIPMKNALPKELRYRADFPVRVAMNPATPNLFLLVSLLRLGVLTHARTLLWHALTLRSRVALSLLQQQMPLLSPVSEAFLLACGIV